MVDWEKYLEGYMRVQSMRRKPITDSCPRLMVFVQNLIAIIDKRKLLGQGKEPRVADLKKQHADMFNFIQQKKCETR
jgi:hypothetical protein